MKSKAARLCNNKNYGFSVFLMLGILDVSAGQFCSVGSPEFMLSLP